MVKGNIVVFQSAAKMQRIKELQDDNKRFSDDMQNHLQGLAELAEQETEIIHKLILHLLLIVSDASAMKDRNKELAELEGGDAE